MPVRLKTTYRGHRCIFPFEYNGELMWDCVKNQHLSPWCPVTVDKNLKPLKKDICRSNISELIALLFTFIIFSWKLNNLFFIFINQNSVLLIF